MLTISRWINYVQSLKNDYVIIKSYKDIEQTIQDNKLGFIFHFQNTAPLDEKLEMFTIYHALGIRVVQLTYNTHNIYGCGCEVELDTGLTNEGVELIAEMNRLGILIDVSHAGYKTALDVISCSKAPVILSHSNVRTLCVSDRNVTDEIIKAIATVGGCVGLNAFPALVSLKSQQPTIDDFLDHIDYMFGS